MMHGMMGSGMGPMMWGMGVLWLLVIIVLVLGAAALIKYLFFAPLKRGPRRSQQDHMWRRLAMSKQPQRVHRNDDRSTRVRQDSRPETGDSGQGSHEEHRLEAERDRHILVDIAHGGAREAHEGGHVRDPPPEPCCICGFQSHIRPTPHSDADRGCC